MPALCQIRTTPIPPPGALYLEGGLNPKPNGIALVPRDSSCRFCNQIDVAAFDSCAASQGACELYSSLWVDSFNLRFKQAPDNGLQALHIGRGA